MKISNYAHSCSSISPSVPEKEHLSPSPKRMKATYLIGIICLILPPKQKHVSRTFDEVEAYLSENRIKMHENPLDFWKSIVPIIVKKHLAKPAT